MLGCALGRGALMPVPYVQVGIEFPLTNITANAIIVIALTDFVSGIFALSTLDKGFCSPRAPTLTRQISLTFTPDSGRVSDHIPLTRAV